jgi:hypothetical protein
MTGVSLAPTGPAVDKVMNEPRGCDVAIINRLVSGYCREGQGSYQTVFWCEGHHKTMHVVKGWTPVGGFSEGHCPIGEVVSDVRLRIRTFVFKVTP